MDSDSIAVIRRYLPFLSSFTLLLGALTHVGSRRDARPSDPLELAEAVLATFFLTRVIAREKAGAPLREPFVEPAPDADPDDVHGDARQPTGSGLQYAVGELVTCPRCLGPWAGMLITFGRVFAPRHARIVTRIMALAGANSIVHAGHAAVSAAADR